MARITSQESYFASKPVRKPRLIGRLATTALLLWPLGACGDLPAEDQPNGSQSYTDPSIRMGVGVAVYDQAEAKGAPCGNVDTYVDSVMPTHRQLVRPYGKTGFVRYEIPRSGAHLSPSECAGLGTVWVNASDVAKNADIHPAPTAASLSGSHLRPGAQAYQAAMRTVAN